LSNLHQIGVALQIYVDDNHNRLPVMYDFATNSAATNSQTVNLVLASQLGSQKILRCPSDDQLVFETTGSSYSWNVLLNGQDASAPKLFGAATPAEKVVVFFDKAGFHAANGPNHEFNFLYADQHLKNFYESP
jgi:hypothetical protein